MAVPIPTNDQILARLRGKPVAKAPVSVPTLKPTSAAPAATKPVVSTPTPFAATKTGIALNALNPINLGKAAVDLYKPLVKDVGGVFKDVARGVLGVGASVVETLPRVASGIGQFTGSPEGGKVANAEYTYNVPGIGKVESLQTKAVREMKQGQDLPTSLAKATGRFILDEPTGVALKPLFLAGGLIFKQFGKDLGPLAEQAIKHENPESFANTIKNTTDPKLIDVISKHGLDKPGAAEEFYARVRAKAEAATKSTPKLSEKPVDTLAREAAPTIKETPLARPPISEELPKSDLPLNESLLDDTSKIAKSQDLNLDHLKISDAARELIEREVADLSPQITGKVGETLTHKEIIAAAKDSAKILQRAVGREQTAEWEKAMLNLRQTIAAQAEGGKVTKEFLDNLVTLKSQGADIARKLNSLAVGADAREMTGKRAILDAVLRVHDNVDEILKAAEKIDFNDPKQATEFYRQFVKPKVGDWLDLLRYNSMLSSPKTHLINIFSNAVNATIAPALTKAIRGGFDFLGSAASGRNRKYFAGESGAYLKGLVKSYKEATARFADVWKGKRDFTNLDYRSVPLATKGGKAAIEKFLSVPTKALEGADQFFMELVQGGEKAALAYRQGKGVAVKNAEQQAKDAASYILYRSELKREGQGHLLNAMDTLTGVVTRLRSDPNPIISYPAKFTFPFISTPTNILKQGVEFSPLGFATIPGAKDKGMQAIKAAIGTGVAIAGGTMIASNRMTWAEPTDQAGKNAFRQSGMQPYSVKFGDRWYSYQKLPPFLAFPLSMIAVVHDAVESKKMDDGTADVVLSAVAKYADFFADQSYFKSMGDLWSAINGDEYAISRLIGNYPQQLVPYRALTGWLARLTDPTQRTIAPDSGFIDKQVQLLMQQYPGLSQMTTPRLGPTGEPVANPERVLNAFSPVQTQAQSPAQAADYANAKELKSLTRKQTQLNASVTAQAQAIVEHIDGMSKEDAIAYLNEQTKGNKQLADKVKTAIADKKKNFTYTEKLIQQLGVENGQRAQYIVQHVKGLSSREEKIQYLNNLKEKGLISKNVQAQIKELLSQQP